MKSMFGPTMGLTGKAMDLRMERQNVVMSNLANLRTPGYNARRVDFEEDLQKALGQSVEGQVTRTDPHHMPVVFDANTFEGQGVTSVQPRIIHGEDRVDLDKEMAVMAKNSLNYNALATIMQKNIEGLKNVISEGGKS